MANLRPGVISEGQLKARGEPRAADTSGAKPTNVVEPAAPVPMRMPVHPAAELEPEVTRRLRAEYAEVSQLAGGLAHEIRNPLSTVSLNLDLLAEDFQSPETPRDRRVLQRVERLQHEVHRLRDILESFLRFARVQPLRLESIKLNAIVEELCDFYEPTAATKGVVIRTYLAPDLPSTAIDADLLKQALLNLILNAEHAMPSGGELILKTRSDAILRRARRDRHGRGYDRGSARADLSTPYFSTRPAGSGLGLPTARKIVESHGGTLTVQSEPGKGSQFTVRLPDERRGSPERRAVFLGGFPKRAALKSRAEFFPPVESIDCERAIGRWTSRSASWWSTTMNRTPRPWLRAWSGSATTASSQLQAAEGLTLIEEQVFDIVITDLMMDGVGGTRGPCEGQARTARRRGRDPDRP